MDRIPMTPDGFDRLQQELRHLKTIERPSVIQAISDARSMGDLSENAEYQYAREKQGFIEGRIAEIEDRLSRAEVIDITKISGAEVKFGATVTISDLDSGDEVIYKIVGVDEADVRKGFISVTSPLARVLISKIVGDTVEVQTPGGSKSYEIVSIKYMA